VKIWAGLRLVPVMKMSGRRIALIFPALLAVGCGNQQIAHPTTDNIPKASEITFTVTDEPTSDRALAAVVDKLKAAHIEHSVISTDADKPVPFGVVDAVLPSSDGYVVLDAERLRLSSFSADGHPRFSLRLGNRKTAGRPRALAWLSAKRLVVGGDKILRVFDTNETPYKEMPSQPHEGNIEGLCLLGNQLFTRAPNTANAIAVLGVGNAGDLRQAGISFRARYRSSHDEIATKLSHGQVACIQGANIVVDGFNVLSPYITAFSAAGERLWTSAIQDYQLPRIVESTVRGRTTIMDEHQEGAYDQLASLASLGPDHVLAQFVRFTPGETLPTLRTFVFDAKSGRGAFVGDRLSLIRSASSSHLFTVDTETFKKLTVMSWDEVSRIRPRSAR